MLSKKTALKVTIRKNVKYVLTFKNFDYLCDCCTFLNDADKCSLYKFNNEYRLLINFKQHPPLYIIKEFCTVAKTDSTEFSLTEEHGEFICGNSAIKKINYAFNKIKAP